jgi:hypothetical protein
VSSGGRNRRPNADHQTTLLGGDAPSSVARMTALRGSRRRRRFILVAGTPLASFKIDPPKRLGHA